MATPAQYEAIGRLALGFNDLEFVFECYTAAILGARELSLALVVSEDGMFRQKAKRFRKVLAALAAEYPELEGDVRTVIELIVKPAEKLADERNGYVHALVVEGFRGDSPGLRIRRGAQVPCDAETITRTASEAAVLAARMHDTCGDLIVALDRARRQP